MWEGESHLCSERISAGVIDPDLMPWHEFEWHLYYWSFDLDHNVKLSTLAVIDIRTHTGSLSNAFNS